MSNNKKRIIDEKQFNSLLKASYEKGVIFGTQVSSGVVLKKLNEMNSENFEEKKAELVNFCKGVIDVERSKRIDGQVGNN